MRQKDNKRSDLNFGVGMLAREYDKFVHAIYSNIRIRPLVTSYRWEQCH